MAYRAKLSVWPTARSAMDAITSPNEQEKVSRLLAASQAPPSPEPPWSIVCPTGRLFGVANHEELLAFVRQELAGDRILEFNICCMLGIKQDHVYRHVQLFQPLSRLQFLKHVDSGESLPVVGGTGKGGLEHFVKLYPRAGFASASGDVARGLRNLLSGTHYSGSGDRKKFSNNWKGWSLVPPPSNLKEWLPRGQLHIQQARRALLCRL